MPLLALRKVHGQPSWVFASDRVEAALTKLGGHLGPVTFRLGRRPVQPFSIAPWAQETLPKGTLSLLRALRGDFFCCPFGGNGTVWRGERHPVHGETANANWTLDGVKKTDRDLTLRTRLDCRVRKLRVEKQVTLVNGQTALYQSHILTGGSGPINLGHHAMLKFPERPASGRISTSQFVYGQVFPGQFESPAQGGYSGLKAGATFRSLERVPLAAGGTADLTNFPAREGFEDLVLLAADPTLPFAWTAVAFPSEGFVWFALRDPRILRQTVLWLSNGGRHYAPWNGRHRAVMGLEDVTSYFHYGIAESARSNPLTRKGIPTTVPLDPKRPTRIDYIMAVAAIPATFDRVATIEPTVKGVQLRSANGRRATCALDLSFLHSR